MACCILGYVVFSVLALEGVQSQDCKRNVIGLRDASSVPFYYFQATSYRDTSSLENNPATWCAYPGKENGSFLEVDLGYQYSLCGISTWGVDDDYTKRYKIELSLDRVHWFFYQESSTDMVFEGNQNKSNEAFNTFHANARFVRFYPTDYETNSCVQVELYGRKILKESCEENLMYDNRSMNITAFPDLPSQNLSSLFKNAGMWCWDSNTSNPYLQIWFGSYTLICTIELTTREGTENSYSLEFSNSSTKKTFVSDISIMPQRILTTRMKITPTQTSGCLIMKLYGFFHTDLLSKNVGLQYGKRGNINYLSDARFTANENSFEPERSRLYQPDATWCSTDEGLPRYLEVALVKKFYILAISVQNKREATPKSGWEVNNNFSLWYSDNSNDWIQHFAPYKVQYGDVVKKYALDEPIATRFVRISLPRNGIEVCLRFELHGMPVEKTQIEWCKVEQELGLRVGSVTPKRIPDKNVHVSSEMRRKNSKMHVRLGARYCWCANKEKKEEHFVQVDFGTLVTVKGLAIEGCPYGELREYKIRYSYDGTDWFSYTTYRNSSQVFKIDSLEDTIVAKWLSVPLITKWIQITVVKFDYNPCLRLEFYGCEESVGTPLFAKMTKSGIINRTRNSTTSLTCNIRGQPGMEATWTRNGGSLDNSFETFNTMFPTSDFISATYESNLTISYSSDKDIYNNFNCIPSINNSRVLLCSSEYSCLVSYPGSNIVKNQSVTVSVTPDIVLPDAPGTLLVYNVKSDSVYVSWKAAPDYLESRLQAYKIHLSSEGHPDPKIYNITSGSDNSDLVQNLTKLSEFTSYRVKILAVNEITASEYSDEIKFVTLLSPNISINHESFRIVSVNEKNITITCQGRSYPAPRVTWKKNGQEIPEENSTQSANNSRVYQILTTSGWDNKSSSYLVVTSELFLRIDGIKYEDYGNYTCEVLNANESSEALSKTVEILFPPRITQGPVGTKVNEGGDIALRCDAEGPPNPAFTWKIYKEKVEIGSIITNKNEIQLQNVTSVGFYNFTVACVASNKGGNASAEVTIEILVKPRIINLNESSTALLYSNVVLSCEVLANPFPDIWWRKDGGNLLNLDNIRLENSNTTLVITRTVLDNIGTYSCHARNYLSSTTRNFTLKLKELPKAYIGKNIRRFSLGEKNKSIICFGSGFPNPKATWKVNSTEIPENSDSSIRSGIYQRRSSNNVALENVTTTLYFNQSGTTFEDFGNYTCEVSIVTEPESEINSQVVQVMFFPFVKKGPSNFTGLQGDDVRFSCEVDGRPVPETLWLFENKTISTNHEELPNGTLLLHSAQNTKEYEGSYSCLAENDAGRSEKSSASLTIHVPARILTISKTEVHQLHTDVKLECNVSGDPRPSVVWKKSNYSNLLTSPKFLLANDNQSLTIMNVTLRDQGTYVCEAKNKYANETGNVTVNVQVSPKANVNVSLNMYLHSVDEEVVVHCSGNGYPPPVIGWFRDGERITTNNSESVYQVFGKTKPDNFLGLISTTLYVNPDKTYHQFGNYSCNVTKVEDGEKALKTVEIILVPKVAITKSPNTSTVLQGTTVEFNCTADGAPQPTISWSRDNGSISVKSSMRSFNARSVLVLMNVTNEDEGKYECSAKNRGRPVKESVSLVVHVKPRILLPLKNLISIQNDTSYKLNCSADGDPALTYFWTRNDDQTIPNAVLTNENKTLLITSVTIENEGLYKCKVTNIEGHASTTTNIIVFAPPRILYSPSNATRNETENVTFICVGNGIPTPNITWMKNGESLVNSTDKYINSIEEQFNVQNSTLTITNLKYDDRGKYSCILQNSARGQDIESAALVVQVRPIAKIKLNSPYVEITRSVRFTCNVYGFPTPQVSWLKNDHPIENSPHYNISKSGNGSNLTWYSILWIENVRRDDSANYSCFLTNKAGSDMAEVTLVVLERPDPLSLSISEITSTSVVLKWKSNFNGNKEILNYTLKYFINGSESNITKQLPSSLVSYNVTSLKPYSNYVFEMSATNEIGTSDISRESKRTLEDVPSSPRSLSVYAVTSTSLNVSWMPPLEENGVIQKYVIYYYRLGSAKSYSKNAAPSERQVEIKYLKPFTNYSVDMAAFTSIGRGDKTEPKNALTYQDAPSSPLNLTVEAKSNTTILVSWLPPKDENGIITQYSVHVQEQRVNSSERKLVEGISILVDKLKPYTYYSFRVRAKTVIDWGNFSKYKTERTDEGLSSAPLNVLAITWSNQSIQLSWKEPECSNGIITQYLVRFKKKTEEVIEFRTANTSRLLVDNLTPYTNYTFWVYARTLAGYGNKSLAAFNMTREGVPTEPQDVDGEPVSNTAINLTWSAPVNPFGEISMYVVYYRETHDREMDWLNKTVKDRMALLTSLNMNTEYFIAVQAVTSAGGGRWSEPEKVKTFAGIPVTPSDPPVTFNPTGKEYEEFDRSTMVAFTVPKFSNKNGNIIAYKVIVAMVDDKVHPDTLSAIFNQEESELLSYARWKKLENKINKAYIAFAFRGDSFDENKNIIIGSGEEFDNSILRRRKRADSRYKNGALIPNKQYAVAVRGYTTKDKYAASQPLQLATQPLPASRESSVDSTIVVVIVMVVVILSALLLAAVWFRVKMNRSREVPDDVNIGIRNLGHAVPLAEFRFYVQHKQFGEEFQNIPKVIDRETSAATSERNMPKNRYKNIIPYDYTRLRLQRDEDDDDTDYINASIIRGLKVPSKYIATQGPLPHTTNDFWKMVWEQEVSSIVMLTGLEERGTVKCYKYWPANTGEKQYGNLVLKLTGETVLADFTIRYFEMKETITGQVRLVQHLHFTAWPDHGVPRYPGPLLHFHNRYRSSLSGPEPVVVHCSAGCGRTGTFIALDYILHKLDEERNDDPSIDVLHIVREMRGQRILMVQTEAQYRFIHYAILEAVLFPDTEIASTDIRVRAAILRETIPGTNKTKGKEVFENLQKRIELESSDDGSSSENQTKNRSKVLPFDYNRVPLNEMQNCTDYINASYICGYQYPRNFIATQHPLPNTVNDFWRMIHEQKSAVIIAICTKKETDVFGSYWPEEGYTSYGPITVALEEVNKDFTAFGFVVRRFKLTDTRDSIGRSFGVTHFHFVDWAKNTLPNPTSLLQLLSEVEQSQRSSGNTLITVHCSDGGGRTGTLCAVTSCIERVKVENNIDLPMTLRNLHAQRNDLIENEVQYIFCYDMVAAFLTSFDDQMYDNFKKSTTSKEEENYPETTTDGENRLVSKF